VFRPVFQFATNRQREKRFAARRLSGQQAAQDWSRSTDHLQPAAHAGRRLAGWDRLALRLRLHSRDCCLRLAAPPPVRWARAQQNRPAARQPVRYQHGPRPKNRKPADLNQGHCRPEGRHQPMAAPCQFRFRSAHRASPARRTADSSRLVRCWRKFAPHLDRRSDPDPHSQRWCAHRLAHRPARRSALHRQMPVRMRCRMLEREPARAHFARLRADPQLAQRGQKPPTDPPQPKPIPLRRD